MSFAKRLYHRLVPEGVRNPIGLVRRDLIDAWQRARAGTPVPPRALLANIQLTPYASEYLAIGERSAASIREALALAGIAQDSAAQVLDFGCGSGRTIRHHAATAWQLTGCDVDAEAVEWSRRALPRAKFDVTPHAPPLPWAAATFDAVYAVSVFTHFSPDAQREWKRELARIIRPGGALVVSTMGPGVIEAFTSLNIPQYVDELARTGTIYVPGTGGFNSNAAFHSPAAVAALFAPEFELSLWSERGLDGFQDLSLLRRVRD